MTRGGRATRHDMYVGTDAKITVNEINAGKTLPICKKQLI